MRVLLLLLVALSALAAAQDDCVWDRVVEQSIDYQVTSFAVRDDEVCMLVGLKVAPPIKATTPHLAIVSLRTAEPAQLVALTGANETNTGEVSEIVTVTDGYHFVVASAGVGLFLVSSDPNTNTPIVEALYPMRGLTSRTRLAVDSQRTVVYVAASDTLYVISVGDGILSLVGSVAGPPEMNSSMTSIAITPDNTAVFVGSSSKAVLATFDVSQPQNPEYSDVRTFVCTADTLAISGDFIYTGNDTGMCLIDYSQGMWLRGQTPIAAVYLSSSPFDPWIYVSETTTLNTMILVQFDPSTALWNMNVTKFNSPFERPNCVAVKHSALVGNEACENVLLSLQYICPIPPPPVDTTGITSATTTGGAAETVTVAATFTTAQISTSGHSHAGRTAGIIIGSLLVVALVALALAGLRWHWTRNRASETTPLL